MKRYDGLIKYKKDYLNNQKNETAKLEGKVELLKKLLLDIHIYSEKFANTINNLNQPNNDEVNIN